MFGILFCAALLLQHMRKGNDLKRRVRSEGKPSVYACVYVCACAHTCLVFKSVYFIQLGFYYTLSDQLDLNEFISHDSGGQEFQDQGARYLKVWQGFCSWSTATCLLCTRQPLVGKPY